MRVLPISHGQFEFRDNIWLTILLLWIVGSIVMLAQSVLGYVALRNLQLAEARLYFQDQLWLELRRDLRRLNRWLIWRRLRKDR